MNAFNLSLILAYFELMVNPDSKTEAGGEWNV